ncbi:MAG: sigma-70 family RNA polymerase sigma factor [Acidimicrobiia bacterium]
MTALDDSALVDLIAAQDRAALAETYRRHADVAFGLARRILNDRMLAEDVVQEVFTRLWNNPGRFDHARGSLRSFVMADVHGRAVDVIRAESARYRREATVAVPEVDGADLEREVIDLVQADAVRTALAQLEPEERTPIELAYFGGHTYREVAVLLATPEGTIKSRIRSGLARFRSLLTEAGYVR